RDDELPTLERPGQLVRLRVDLEAEPGEEPVGALGLVELDPDSPVVARHRGKRTPAAAPTSASGRPKSRSDTPVGSRRFVIPPRKNGQPAPRRRAVSTSAASPTSPSSRRWWISSATASRTSSTIWSRLRGACSTTTISSLPSAYLRSVAESGNR